MKDLKAIFGVTTTSAMGLCTCPGSSPRVSLEFSSARLLCFFPLFAVMLLPGPLSAQSESPGRAVLLISIDGLRPDYVLEADKQGLTIPHLRALALEGASATGVRGVLPTATYPSHTTIVTGVSPVRHGIVGNKPFGHSVKDLDVWYYYAEDLRAPTLWDAAAKHGYRVGSVSWPVTVGAPAIHYNIPEYNLTRTPEDVKITRGAATPGLMARLAEKAGAYLTEVSDSVKRDWARTRYAVEIIRQKQTRFLTVHLAATDSIQHRHGPFAVALWPALEEIDVMVGELRAAMRTEDPRAVVCVVSDHGFAPVTNVLWLDAALVKVGLITLKGSGTSISAAGIADWVVQSWPAGGSAAMVMKDPDDRAARARVKTFLHDLAADHANGIAAILESAAIEQMGGAPGAQFWIDMRPGYMISASLQPSIVAAVSVRGAHGYSPRHDEMNASFFIAGDGIRRGLNLGEIDMRSIAPTIARAMGVPFPSADLPAQEVFEARAAR